MQSAAKNPGKGQWIQRYTALGPDNPEPQRFKHRVPTHLRKVVIRQRYAMGAVADPVHKSQRGVVERIRGNVILDEDETTAHSAGVGEDRFGRQRVVQNVDEEAAVKRRVVEWQAFAVKEITRDRAVGTRMHLNAANGCARRELPETYGQRSVAAANIENAGPSWKKSRERLCQDFDAASKDQTAMRLPDQLRAGVSVGTGVCSQSLLRDSALR